MPRIVRLGELVLTIYDAPFEGDAFEYDYYYDFETKILNKSGEKDEQKGQTRGRSSRCGRTVRQLTCNE